MTGPDADLSAEEVRGARTAQQIVETLQTVLTALILAFIFRAYAIEAFIIPTGSMAESLLGEHGTRICRAASGSMSSARCARRIRRERPAFLEGLTVRCRTVMLRNGSTWRSRRSRAIALRYSKWPRLGDLLGSGDAGT